MLESSFECALMYLHNAACCCLQCTAANAAGTCRCFVPMWGGCQSHLYAVLPLCRPNSTAVYALPFAEHLAAAAAAPARGGCGVRSVDNSTLIPTLLRDAAVPTAQPLLVLLTANVSLGLGLGPGAIAVSRCGADCTVLWGTAHATPKPIRHCSDPACSLFLRATLRCERDA
jgi:hypothetical protein